MAGGKERRGHRTRLRPGDSATRYLAARLSAADPIRYPGHRNAVLVTAVSSQS
jgi:hypothetical protein